jgi:hypothetical protein
LRIWWNVSVSCIWLQWKVWLFYLYIMLMMIETCIWRLLVVTCIYKDCTESSYSRLQFVQHISLCQLTYAWLHAILVQIEQRQFSSLFFCSLQVEELEKEIVESREKIEFFRAKMQELVSVICAWYLCALLKLYPV